MSQHGRDAAIARLVEALRSSYAARKGVPPALEALTREYGRAQRESGASISAVVIEAKALVVQHCAEDELIFTPKIVGWTIAGFFQGPTPRQK